MLMESQNDRRMLKTVYRHKTPFCKGGGVIKTLFKGALDFDL